MCPIWHILVCIVKQFNPVLKSETRITRLLEINGTAVQPPESCKLLYVIISSTMNLLPQCENRWPIFCEGSLTYLCTILRDTVVRVFDLFFKCSVSNIVFNLIWAPHPMFKKGLKKTCNACDGGWALLTQQ